MIRTAHQARAILDILAEYRGANERALADWFPRIGLDASRAALSALFDRLEPAGLIRTQIVDLLRVIELMSLGGEVASGTERIEWVAAPELPA